MRIVQVVNWATPSKDAAVEQALNTAQALVENGAEVTLLMPRGRYDPELGSNDFSDFLGKQVDFGVEQWPASAFLEKRLPAVTWLQRCSYASSARQADVLLTRAPMSLVTGAGRGRRFAFDGFRTWPDNLPLLRGLFRHGIQHPRCLGLLLHSDYAAKSFLRLGIEPGKVLVAHNGVDVERYQTDMTIAQARSALNLPLQGRIVAYAGRVVPWKGVDSLLDIARARPSLHLVLAGSTGAGEVEQAARKLPNVSLLPWLDTDGLTRLFAAADVLAIPPSRKGLKTKRTVLPLKTFMYLASGRPILAPRLPDTDGLLVDGVNALLVEPDDTEAALAGLDRLFSSPALARELGNNGRRLAATMTWHERGRKVLSFLDHRLSSSRARR